MVRQEVWRLAKYCVWLGRWLWRLASAIIPFLAAAGVWHLPSFLSWLIQSQVSHRQSQKEHSHARLSKSRWDPTLPSAMSFKHYFLKLPENLKYFDLRVL